MKEGAYYCSGLVVLLSILAAFFLEGWRDDRELARELQQELASIRVELERNRDLIAAEIATLDRITTAGAAFAEALASSNAPDVLMSDTLVFLGAQWHPSCSPSLGAPNALISSGRLAQVQGTDLRLGLAGLSEAVNDALEEEVFARQVSVEQLLPLIGERADLIAIPNSPAVRNALIRRNTWLAAATTEFAQLDLHMADLIAAVGMEDGS